MATVVETKQAKNDLREILRYLRKYSRSAAKQLALDVAERHTRLASFPRFGREREEFGPGLRSTVLGKYVLIYHATDEVVTVVRMFFGARDIDTLMRQTDWEPPEPA